jgi:hypothetical protein
MASMNDPQVPDVRTRTLHLAAVAAVAGALLVLVFGLGALTSQPAEPLEPDERLGEWRLVSLDRKEATARQLLDIWKKDGTLSPRVVAEMNDPQREQQYVDELVAGLDLVNNPNTPAYIPPGETIRISGRDVVTTNGWDK